MTLVMENLFPNWRCFW